ncbi:MAG: response regulator [Thermaceae bacterium]|nr:response regulator [Thermaceae bacterium]
MVEDDPWVGRVNRALVEAETGFTVVAQAETVRQGRELVQALEPDLLLMDVYLPDGSGLELVQELRGMGLGFEVILITAASDLASVQRALHGGALDYLIKPFQQPRLREALGRYRLRTSVVEPNFTQSRLDRLLGHQGEERLPKGLDPLTLEQIRSALMASEQPLSAEEVGSRVGLSRVSAWRYLEYLSESGSLQAEMVYGSVGRPTKRYKPR